MPSRNQIKFVLITMYELSGEDRPGEFQYFCEAEGLRPKYPLPAGAFDVWANRPIQSNSTDADQLFSHKQPIGRTNYEHQHQDALPKSDRPHNNV